MCGSIRGTIQTDLTKPSPEVPMSRHDSIPGLALVEGADCAVADGRSFTACA